MSDSQDTKGKQAAVPEQEEIESTGDVQSSEAADARGDDGSSGLAASLKKLKKKSRKSKDDDNGGEGSAEAKPASRITENMAESLLELNPSLKAELAGVEKDKATELLRKMDVADLMTGLSVGGKNQKDMASYKFWQTQPVPRFDDKKDARAEEGPIKVINPEEVSKEPDALIEGFEWVTLDLTDETELQELYDLLTFHYVEDDNAMFRFNYSAAFLNWYVPPFVNAYREGGDYAVLLLLTYISADIGLSNLPAGAKNGTSESALPSRGNSSHLSVVSRRRSVFEARLSRSRRSTSSVYTRNYDRSVSPQFLSRRSRAAAISMESTRPSTLLESFSPNRSARAGTTTDRSTG